MIAIIDYGLGNLQSVQNALDHLGTSSIISGESSVIKTADGLILPGVGAFPDAMQALRDTKLDEWIQQLTLEKGVPILGICLGMQLLLSESEEFKVTKGLDLIQGRCVRIEAQGLKIPHMGWNSLAIDKPSPLLNGVEQDSYVYFVHSYRADVPQNALIAHTTYGQEISAIIGRGCIYGTQFHPEKSEKVGLKILENFIHIVKGDSI